MDLAATLAHVGVRIPEVLIPRAGVDLNAWAVVACDQFTSQPEYWVTATELVGDRPSTLNLIFPEAYLAEPRPEMRVRSINTAMASYLAGGVFEAHPETMVLVRRETRHGVVRWGLILALDLERYSWDEGGRTLIRATEGTILDRLPPRVAVRREAALELPHIMVLVDDPDASLIEPLAAATGRLNQLYDTELMLDGGRVTGWAVREPSDLASVAVSLKTLHSALDPDNPLLFAMGDGNHSFATAKSLWNDLRSRLSEAERVDHPARYCLVEVENIHDPGLEFEPIHRVLFETNRAEFEVALAAQCAGFDRVSMTTLPQVLAAIERPGPQSFGYVDAAGLALYRLDSPAASLAAGTLQRVIDDLVADASEVDYIHGTEVTAELGGRPGNVGLFLPEVAKNEFFASIRADGALPRKTFSLGEAQDKRYYLEARRLS